MNIFDDQEYLMKNQFFKDKNGLLFYYNESECEKFLEWNQERREKNRKQTASKNSKIKILNTVEIIAEELQQEEEQQEEQDKNNGLEELALVDVSNSDIFNIDDHDKKEEEEGEKQDQEEQREQHGEKRKLKIGCCDADDASSS